ncbi:MAG: universal stress protein [Actinobacteria bacterium]|nr:universal stress protein [Actinomycetota bacterium]
MAPHPSTARPVMLATLEVPFDAEAASFAVDSAVESGQPLIVANAVEIPLGPATVFLQYGDLDPTPEDAAALRAPAQLAHSLGVRVERFRLKSPHPVDAILELAAERAPGLLVFGPDRRRVRGRRYRKAARAIRERAGCLVWFPE